MENATKALLIAAAILMIIMVLSLLVIFWDQVSGYFSTLHDAKMQEQLVEFNSQFQNYLGKTIRGNELVSIMNKIIDYNNYQSDIVGYDRVKIDIYLKGLQNGFKYENETGSDSLIKGTTITNATNDNDIERIATTSNRLVNNFTSSGFQNLTDVKLQKMSSNIDIIVNDTNKKDRARFLTKLLGYEITEDDSRIEKIKNATYQYYQFTQFKRALFKCTDVFLNENNGRVNSMRFEVVTEKSEDGKDIIKFD